MQTEVILNISFLFIFSINLYLIISLILFELFLMLVFV
jgi:hypothetical protein